MKYLQSFMTLKDYSATSIFRVSSVIVSLPRKFSYHPWLVSLTPPRWNSYSQVSAQISFDNFKFSPVSQAVSTGALGQGVLILSYWKKFLLILSTRVLLILPFCFSQDWLDVFDIFSAWSFKGKKSELISSLSRYWYQIFLWTAFS